MMQPPHSAFQQQPSPWCNSRRKRLLDIVVATFALVGSAPFMLLIALAIRATSPGPVFFRQWRSGLKGHPFQLLKFRTMQVAAEQSGPRVTRAGDARMTRVGRWLRKWKADELPQLLNVLRGEMSIVGPRPDLDEFWREASEAERQVIALKPGLTGAATLSFCNEEEYLAHVPQSELVGFYVRSLLPRKARLDCDYAAEATFLSDCRVVFKTIAGMFSLSKVRHGRETYHHSHNQ
jgi:lipopolysaccharide/colanic/teichoic acid biosynthesis glycosyltransferase